MEATSAFKGGCQITHRMRKGTRAVYADSAYRSKDTGEKLAKDGIASQICEKGTRAAALTEEQKDANRKKAKVRARVEHVFGAQGAMGGHWVRTIGLLRAKVKIGINEFRLHKIQDTLALV